VKSGKKATGYQYEIISPDEYEQLKKSIASVLDEVLEACKQASAPNVSHSQNGSPKAKKTSKIKGASQRNRKGKQG
jgi:S-ribosylhomocysteine lyase LuxS involved in autoinducer biosynthesis